MKTIFDKIAGVTQITPDMLLPEHPDYRAIWESYYHEDPGAICGGCTEDTPVNKVRAFNANLQQSMGIKNYLAPGGTVLDVGAGLESTLYHLSYHHTYLPVDVFKYMPSTILIDGHGSIEFPDDSMDYIICTNMFQHISKNTKRAYLNEFGRLINKRHGRIFLTSCTPTSKSFTVDNTSYAITDKYFVELMSYQDQTNIILECGFQIISVTQRFDGMVSWWLNK